jgi:hypothetical protein
MQNDLISRSAVIDIIHKEIERTNSFAEHETQINIEFAVKELPCAYDVGKVLEQLEEATEYLKDCTKYGNKDAKQQAKSYSTMMMYEVADIVDDLIAIVRNGGKE